MQGIGVGSYFDLIKSPHPVASKVLGVEDGHSFDLGSRKLEVLHLPGHSPGSLG